MASAELAPLARVGGMAEAVAGLVNQLRADGVDVTVVVPDYDTTDIPHDADYLDVPAIVGPVAVRTAEIEGIGPVELVMAPQLGKPHPYNDGDGNAFTDNDHRFFAFSAGVAALVERLNPDVLHVNDWHTGAALGLLPDPPQSVLTIHTLAYQGIAAPSWLDHLIRGPELFAWYGDFNPLLGAIRLADRVVTVSPNYAADIVTEPHGMGLHHHLAELGPRLHGITNGIDTSAWNPETDQHLTATYSAANLRGKARNRTALLGEMRLASDGSGSNQPLIGMVSRLVEQKGIDLVVDAARFLTRLPARLAILGSGDSNHAAALHQLAANNPGRIAFVEGYDAGLSHRIFAGADLLLMPSRFEPCGLAQMQAMAYGTIPVVTDVGGLHDTVIDEDRCPDAGTGFVSDTVDVAGVVDALHRATRAWSSTRRRAGIRRRGMATDWSWASPANTYQSMYDELTSG